MNFGLLVIGDEILSGRRRDLHFNHLLELFQQRGMALDWVQYVGDQPQRIVQILKRSFADHDVVFSTGGIGATPDDHTRQCVAQALDVPLVINAQAKAIVQARFEALRDASAPAIDWSTPEYQRRLEMIAFPQGADVLPNPYNQIPGFFIQQHYFMPGFPQMAWPMMAWVLDHIYPAYHHAQPYIELACYVFDVFESTVTPLMQTIEANYPTIKVFSLPVLHREQQPSQPPYIELGVKGEPEMAHHAFRQLREGLVQLGGRVVEMTADDSEALS